MRAIKIESIVLSDHTLHIELPSNVAAGPAEVIILIPEPQPEHSGETLDSFLEKLSEFPIRGRSKEEIDTYLSEERNSWDTES